MINTTNTVYVLEERANNKNKNTANNMFDECNNITNSDTNKKTTQSKHNNTIHQKKTRTKNKNRKPRIDKLKIIYSNANGVNSKIESIKNNLQTYECDIYCITETKLKSEPPPIEGYKWETKNRSNRQGGGVAILIKSSLKNITTRLAQMEDQNQEIIWI